MASVISTGPAVSIDTACSSALVGTHMGAQHLNKVGGAALAAGVNLMLAEHTTAATQVCVRLISRFHNYHAKIRYLNLQMG